MRIGSIFHTSFKQTISTDKSKQAAKCDSNSLLKEDFYRNYPSINSLSNNLNSTDNTSTNNYLKNYEDPTPQYLMPNRLDPMVYPGFEYREGFKLNDFWNHQTHQTFPFSSSNYNVSSIFPQTSTYSTSDYEKLTSSTAPFLSQLTPSQQLFSTSSYSFTPSFFLPQNDFWDSKKLSFPSFPYDAYPSDWTSVSYPYNQTPTTTFDDCFYQQANDPSYYNNSLKNSNNTQTNDEKLPHTDENYTITDRQTPNLPRSKEDFYCYAQSKKNSSYEGCLDKYEANKYIVPMEQNTKDSKTKTDENFYGNKRINYDDENYYNLSFPNETSKINSMSCVTNTEFKNHYNFDFNNSYNVRSPKMTTDSLNKPFDKHFNEQNRPANGFMSTEDKEQQSSHTFFPHNHPNNSLVFT